MKGFHIFLYLLVTYGGTILYGFIVAYIASFSERAAALILVGTVILFFVFNYSKSKKSVSLSVLFSRLQRELFRSVEVNATWACFLLLEKVLEHKNKDNPFIHGLPLVRQQVRELIIHNPEDVRRALEQGIRPSGAAALAVHNVVYRDILNHEWEHSMSRGAIESLFRDSMEILIKEGLFTESEADERVRQWSPFSRKI